MKRLCIISRNFPFDSIGGGEFAAYNLWKYAKKEYNTELIAGWQHDPSLLPKKAHKIDLRGSNRFIRYANFYFETKQAIHKINPDIIHSTAVEVPIMGIPTIITVHHVSHLIKGMKSKNPYIKLRNWVQTFLLKRRLGKATIIITDTEATRQDLVKLGISSTKISVIYLGIDTDKFKPAKIKKSKFSIIIPSRISREKGQLTAISAFEELPRKIGDKCELSIVGFVSDKEYLNEIKSKANIHIKIIPNVKNIIPYLQKADIVVFPSLIDEGFGFVPLEAMACEKPVIASDSPAIREVMGNCGILVQKGDVFELRNAMETLYGDARKRSKLAKMGRKRAIEKFSWKATYLNYKKIYDKLLGKSNGSSI